jgi:hypothetical protein
MRSTQNLVASNVLTCHGIPFFRHFLLWSWHSDERLGYNETINKKNVRQAHIPYIILHSIRDAGIRLIHDSKRDWTQN